MKIIFLDIDGVLNGWDFSEYIKYNIWNIVPSKKVKNFIRTKLSHSVDIDKKRVKRLAKICKETNAKIVFSSSWRNGLLHNTGERDYKNDSHKQFWDLIDKYNIEVIDKTPRLKTSYKREDEIKAWLSEHNDIENYIILDDEDADLQLFVGNHLVKTSHKDYKGYIACSERKWSGLDREHVKQAIKILNKKD